MAFRKGSLVWVYDKDSAWVESEVLDFRDNKFVTVVTVYGKKVNTSAEKLLPRDPEADHGGVDDMTKLTYLHEPGVLYNLARRYSLNEIYTYTGSILIAVNPFAKLPHLYDFHMMEQYNGVRFGELSPHVFAVADASYRAMISEARSQSILVSGESGAGKTETTKLIMQYLTYVGGRATADDRKIEQQVLESNPLLEAFGNAKTIRNDNSSRFGKFVEIQFDRHGRISGAAIRTYLLERSRVVQITDPERNYHCFYQLCASGKDAEKYKLGHPSTFFYLNQSKAFELEGVSSKEEYLKTRRAMDIVGISQDDQESVFRTLAAILHIGNIKFSPGKEHDSSVIKDSQSNFHLTMAADLLMCDRNLLVMAICSRSIQTRDGSIIKALDCAAAAASRDALAKTLYARLFDWLVETINKSVGQDPSSYVQIGVLDIYGFECFKSNSFEQFCINFANEKLQQHFNEHVFKMEQEEYKSEEINWSYIEFIDNQDILDLIEKKPIGIISLLDEACMFPKSTHETFSTKLFQSFGTHPRLEKAKFSETDFTLSHYAGKVNYHTNSFLDKNRDYVVAEHLSLLSSSRCSFISRLFTSSLDESPRSSYKFSSVASRFKQQLQALMDTLNSTEPHYVRCVKPNSLNRPQKFENLSVLQQLRCGGVLEAVRISLAGYPTRRTYSEFVDRFGILVPRLMDERLSEKVMVEKILRKLNLENFQLGRTKVFLRAGQIGILDSQRSEVLDNAAKLIQNRFKTHFTRKLFLITRSSAICLQSYCRGCLAKRNYAKRRELAAALSIQKNVRMWMSQLAFLRICSAALLIQACIRRFAACRKLASLKEQRAAAFIQASWRLMMAFKESKRKRHAAVSIQCAWRQKLARKHYRRIKSAANEAGALREAKNKLEKKLEELSWRLAFEKKLRVSNEEAKLVEISKLQTALQSLNADFSAQKLAVAKEQDINAQLQGQLNEAKKSISELQSRLIEMEELSKENQLLKTTVESLEKRNRELEQELLDTRKYGADTSYKLQGVEERYLNLHHNLQDLEEKLSSLEDENHILRQKALSISPINYQASTLKSFPELKYLGGHSLTTINQHHGYETPIHSKYHSLSHGLSELRRPRITTEKHEDYHEIFLRCIKEDLGFKDGKPVAACLIYKCLLQWHIFEAERTAIFDYIIESINDTLKISSEKDILPYWLSNASALLCLLQRNLRPNGFLTTPVRRSVGSLGSSTKTTQGLKSPLKLIGSEESTSHVDAKYPAILFKQQLTACLEKIFGLIRDNLKKEISPLLSLCIQAPKSTRSSVGRTPKSSSSSPQQPLSSQWDRIIKFLDSLMERLQKNFVPSFFTRKLITQVFSSINIQLFNSLLLRRECCNFSNGEYVKSGLAVLEKWIADTTEEYAGTSWHELNIIRQAVGFLVIHQKRKKTLDEITQELCPALSLRQIYRICTMYWDDKYSTQSVTNEIVATMREMVSKDSHNTSSMSFLLDEDLSIPFSTEDISKAIPAIDPSGIEIPECLEQFSSAQFLLQRFDQAES